MKEKFFDKNKIDILREVGSIAAGHASTALSSTMGRKIKLYLPTVDIIYPERIKDVIDLKGVLMILQNQILCGLKGKVIFIFEEKQLYKIVDICYKFNKDTKISALTEVSVSLIKEIDNIIVCAYLNALGNFLDMVIIPSLPILLNAPFDAIARLLVWDYEKERYILLVRADFEEEESKIKGHFWLLLTSEAVKEIEFACEKMLKK